MSDVSIKDMIQIRTLFYSNMVALEIIADEDEMVQGELGETPAVIQWKIEGIAAGYIMITNGKPKLYMDAIHPEPTITITFADARTARTILNGNGDVTKAFIKGQVQIDGDLKKGLKLLAINEVFQDYIDFFKSIR